MSETNASAARAAAVQTAFPSGFSAIAEGYDVVLCDVWGVLHNGLTAYPGASDALTRFRRAGGTVILVSNAPRPGTKVMEQLDRLGVPRTAYDDVVTSGDMTRMQVEARLDEPVFHLGPERDLPIFEGLPVRFADGESAAYVVCSGLLDDRSETPEDYRGLFERLRARDLPMICANPDIVVEVGDTLVYCAGALATLYEEMGGAATYMGKPHEPVYREALARAARIRGAEDVPVSRVIAIGDAIRTDVAGARGIGASALFIAKGIHAEDLRLAGNGLDPAIAAPWFAEQAHQPDAAMEILVW
ncbi:TIGR01459 family HAD-type hydrolase [Salinarimonas ramus]|uniref:Haloacid dehalogenase n=1 Tax=Salinarimonas ramus TaxID=690164 RepID=A0A917V3H6_9HYPH|nr:TIGR01459 family HAD-type hydrolase [Salinarimonas ramus]GGK31070.1 haloacid dehalogenase [Salinarimonas ramus]